MFGLVGYGAPTVCLKATKETQAALLQEDPDVFLVAPFFGRWAPITDSPDRGTLRRRRTRRRRGTWRAIRRPTAATADGRRTRARRR
ncbi:hypothetical protein [Rhodococcus sp. ACS1]|uniref:hypothetical protein n=1 Tax=Rhodococcus sp. ACS1 TaxID=2028570 RepID=UPI00359CA198